MPRWRVAEDSPWHKSAWRAPSSQTNCTAGAVCMLTHATGKIGEYTACTRRWTYSRVIGLPCRQRDPGTFWSPRRTCRHSSLRWRGHPGLFVLVLKTGSVCQRLRAAGWGMPGERLSGEQTTRQQQTRAFWGVKSRGVQLFRQRTPWEILVPDLSVILSYLLRQFEQPITTSSSRTPSQRNIFN